MLSTRELSLSTHNINTILPRWYARFLVLPSEDPSKSDCEMWIEDAMMNIFCHQTINVGLRFHSKFGLFAELADVADILLD